MTTREPDDLHDTRVDAAWRATAREEPPRALDDMIRAAARREIGAGPHSIDVPPTTVPQSLRPERWWWPLAAAATIGAVAVGILQLIEADHVVAPPTSKAVVSDAPATLDKTQKQEAPALRAASVPILEEAAKSEVAATQSPAPASNVGPPAAAKPVEKLRKDAAVPSPREERARDIAPAPAMNPAPPPPAVSSPAPAAEPFPSDKLERESKEAQTPEAASTSEGSQSVAPARALRGAPRSQQTQDMRTFAQPAGVAKLDRAAAPGAKVAPKLPVPDWVALIRKLRDEGNSDEAAKELAAFRDAYTDPDALLPPDLRDWKPPATR